MTDVARPLPHAVPVVLRASRRTVAMHLRLAVAATLLAAAGWWLQLTWLPLLLCGVAVLQLVRWAHTGRGYVELGAEAVTVRRVVGTIGVRDVSLFLVRTTGFGRHVRLRRRLHRTLRLPAPVSPWFAADERFDEQVEAVHGWCASRFGAAAGPTAVVARPRWAYPALALTVLVAVCMLDRPWGWVSGSETARIPQVCPMLQPQVKSLAFGAAAEPVSAAVVNGQANGCRWNIGSGRDLVVVMTRYDRSGLHSGTSVAAAHMLAGGPGAAAWSTGTLRPLRQATRLGDASLTAYIGPGADGDEPSGAVVVARRANVIVEAYLGPNQDGTGSGLRDEDVAALLTAVRTALASFSVG